MCAFETFKGFGLTTASSDVSNSFSSAITKKTQHTHEETPFSGKWNHKIYSQCNAL